MPSPQPHASTHRAPTAAGAEVARWVERLARFGYLAKGVVYAVVGILAARLAFGSSGGETTGARGALHEIGSQPWGQGLLLLTGLGLACYAGWKLVQGIRDPERKGTDAEGIVKRLGFVGSGVIHASLAITAFQLATGSGGGGGDDTQGKTAQLMSYPAGLWLVGLVGLVTIAVGLYQFYGAWNESFLRKWNVGAMSPEQRRWGTRAGRWGLAARGVVFLMMGFFFVRAAVQHDASEAIGLDGALTKLASSSTGPWLLGLVALGLVAYAVFCFTQARYRHFQVR